MKRLVATLALAVLGASFGLALAGGEDDPEAMIRELHGGKARAFFARCTDEMKAAVPLAKLEALAATMGKLESVVTRSKRDATHVLRCRFANATVDVEIALDASNHVAGLFYRPVTKDEAPARDMSDYKTKTRLTLPFKGAWIVGNGGRDPTKNHHAANRNQRFASDFVKPHGAEGKALEDYEAFGSEVVAPADGVVVQTIDGSIDLPPGEADPYVIPGNLVVIDHGNGEWSFLCHFKRGSIAVKPGDKVARGALLGLCGNTGNTSEPHIHFHLANAAVMHRGDGLPAPFAGILVDGKRVESAEPERGQRVENGAP